MSQAYLWGYVWWDGLWMKNSVWLWRISSATGTQQWSKITEERGLLPSLHPWWPWSSDTMRAMRVPAAITCSRHGDVWYKGKSSACIFLVMKWLLRTPWNASETPSHSWSAECIEGGRQSQQNILYVCEAERSGEMWALFRSNFFLTELVCFLCCI